MIISKHFKDPKRINLVRFIEDHSYTNNFLTHAALLYDDMFLLFFNQTKVLKQKYWLTYEEKISTILKRSKIWY